MFNYININGKAILSIIKDFQIFIKCFNILKCFIISIKAKNISLILNILVI